MKKGKIVGLTKAICYVLITTCITMNLNCDSLLVNAMELQSENNIKEMDTSDISSEIETESDLYDSQEQQSSIVYETGIEETEEATEKMDVWQDDINWVKKSDFELHHRNISQKIDNCVVEVNGNIPLEAKLMVRRREITKEIKENIVELSNIVNHTSDFCSGRIDVYSYDISLLVDNSEYEPFLFDEMVEVNFKANNHKDDKVKCAEVFHVDEETQNVEQIKIVEKDDEQVKFETDHFSQYIILSETTYKGESNWKYYFLGQKEKLEILSKGVYGFRLYGAQGENSENYEGGKGGFVSAQIELNKGDVIEVEVGGQNGFLEGGVGTATHGGGASKLYLNGKLVAVAGGGAGALINRDGGVGGTQEHKTDGAKGMDSGEDFSAGGGAGYQGGCAGFVTYHMHEGNESEEGGCYTKPVYHAHTEQCYGIVCSHSRLKWDRVWYDHTGNDFSDWHCLDCGRGFVSTTTYGEPWVSPTYGWICKEDGKIIGYDLECGMTTQTIVGAQPSYGGSNFINESFQEIILQSGVRSGDGFAEIEMKKIDCASIRFENDGQEYKTFYVEKGTLFTDYSLDNPSKKPDERYSYKFLGWDNVETETEERCKIEEVFSRKIISDRLYRAVYEKIPRQYTITFDAKDAIVTGTKDVVAIYDKKMQDVVVPQKEGYIFAGYYVDIDDEGTKYYDAYGKAIRHSDFTKDSMLSAKWEDPLSIVKDPQNEVITRGYSGIMLATEARLSCSNGYDIKYQWYVNSKEMINGATEIKEGYTNKLLIPQGYGIGKRYFFCKVTVSGSVDQKIDKYTKISTVEVTKGNITDEKISLKENNITYDGNMHELKVQVENDVDAKIYYSEKPLTKDNYTKDGVRTPFSFKDAGKYQSYVYIVSNDYEDYSGKIMFEIKKRRPLIYLASKNTTYEFGRNQKIDDAIIVGENGENIDNILIDYTYYTDATLVKKTTENDGAKAQGGEPSEVGTYYVVAKTRETQNYESASSNQSVMLNILGNAIPYSVSDYVGIYDGEEHELSIYIEDRKKASIYFSDSEKLTKLNYLQKGTREPYKFKNAGDYIINYAIVSKLTNELDNVLCGTARIQIKKAEQVLNKEIPVVNSDCSIKIPEDTVWEYRDKGKNNEWNLYEPGTKLQEGEYEFRLPGNQNYESSESVIIIVKKQIHTTTENTNNTQSWNFGVTNAVKEKNKPKNMSMEQFNKEIVEEKAIFDFWPIKKIRRKDKDLKYELQKKEEKDIDKDIVNDIEPIEEKTNYLEESIAFEMPMQEEQVGQNKVNSSLRICVTIGFIVGSLTFILFLLLFLLLCKKKNKNNQVEK